jgi:hypothetical protein
LDLNLGLGATLSAASVFIPLFLIGLCAPQTKTATLLPMNTSSDCNAPHAMQVD